MSSYPIDGVPVGPRRLAQRLDGPAEPAFSICVMLTDWTEYESCVATFRAGGFAEDCEWLVIDNSDGNRADGYVALNEFLQAASGSHVVICHQDILLLEHSRHDLEERLAGLYRVDPNWAVCGNAGVDESGWPAICISHPYADNDIKGGPFPVKVMSLDENFLVIRREANLALSRELSGFHHYGVELCLMANVLGWTSYVIDFHLRHNSAGTMDGSYFRSSKMIADRYRRAFRPRWAYVITRTPFFVSGRAWEWPIARGLLLFGRALGVYPRSRDWDNEAKLAQRGRIRAERYE